MEEKFIARCNQDGMTPVQSEHRVNLRTMSATSKERLEMRVEERHGWALRTSRHEVTVGNCWSVAFWVICLVTVGN